MLAAGDTFRAAAIEQLERWGERTGAPVVARERGADAAAVAHDAIEAAQQDGVDVLLVDTAGRLHTKVNLMAELDKVGRVISRQLPGAPHEVLLTVDATTGQNGLRQAKMFNEVAGVTGVILTKLDGTAKGGIALAIANEVRCPDKAHLGGREGRGPAPVRCQGVRRSTIWRFVEGSVKGTDV